MPGEKQRSIRFDKGIIDSVVFYYDNGKVFETGFKDEKDNSFGKWNRYTREGFLSDTQEFFVINNDFGKKGSKLNQILYYNKAGDTMFYGNHNFNYYNQNEFREDTNKLKQSIFVRFDFPKGDTLSIAEPFPAIAEDYFPFWEKKNSESYVVMAKEKFNFNKDFSNEKQVKLDTFFCLEKDKVNKNVFPKANKKHTVAFGRWFDTPGKKILRGYMVEYHKRKPTPNDSIVKQERRTYFEKIIYVKDTIH